MASHLETLKPADDWDPGPHVEAIERLRAQRDDLLIRVWCGDWCKDCRAILPAFGAALDAAEIPSSAINEYPVEKADDGSKSGPLVEEYGITLIPTIVLELDGQELARFVEDADQPPVEVLAAALPDTQERPATS